MQPRTSTSLQCPSELRSTHCLRGLQTFNAIELPALGRLVLQRCVTHKFAFHVVVAFLLNGAVIRLEVGDQAFLEKKNKLGHCCW